MKCIDCGQDAAGEAARCTMCQKSFETAEAMKAAPRCPHDGKKSVVMFCQRCASTQTVELEGLVAEAVRLELQKYAARVPKAG
jgi:primosomal protein N'